MKNDACRRNPQKNSHRVGGGLLSYEPSLLFYLLPRCARRMTAASSAALRDSSNASVISSEYDTTRDRNHGITLPPPFSQGGTPMFLTLRRESGLAHYILTRSIIPVNI